MSYTAKVFEWIEQEKRLVREDPRPRKDRPSLGKLRKIVGQHVPEETIKLAQLEQLKRIADVMEFFKATVEAENAEREETRARFAAQKR